MTDNTNRTREALEGVQESHRQQISRALPWQSAPRQPGHGMFQGGERPGFSSLGASHCQFRLRAGSTGRAEGTSIALQGHACRSFDKKAGWASENET